MINFTVSIFGSRIFGVGKYFHSKSTRPSFFIVLISLFPEIIISTFHELLISLFQ
ncbi:hypothetical protein IV36_GL001607 [Liquorilactobacillus mali]|uniref:Uncharacterized protein n=1 Tax=Liquorilactobacillus mali TaxID=1618 RepID=A0A0R2FDV3_9LACO|nr:hypothetical protein IV36_GL001607 [Liquorilactobacillus mali]